MGRRLIKFSWMALILYLFVFGCTTGPAPTPVGLAITTTALPVAVEGSLYSATVQAVCVGACVAPVTWSTSCGTVLPPGLSLNPVSGAITGTPPVGTVPSGSAIKVYKVVFTATDSTPGIPSSPDCATLLAKSTSFTLMAAAIEIREIQTFSVRRKQK